jgi:uncharacterized protein YodC (DUF2158 family)
MTPRFNPGDVVRPRGDALEMAVHHTPNDWQVGCMWFTGGGDLRTNSLEASALELVWKADREEVSFNPGDVVQLPIEGPRMTVDQGGKDGIRCVWFSPFTLLAQRFDARVLWLARAMHDPKVRLDPGDLVQLRSGGPSMTVEQGGEAQVRCLSGSGALVWLDARTLEIDYLESMGATSQALVALGKEQGIELASLCHHSQFLHQERYIIFWRRSKIGVVYYSMQGRVEVLPEEFKESANAFHGMWCEAGHLDDIEQAFAFLEAWVLARKEVDELPRRYRSRYGIGGC